MTGEQEWRIGCDPDGSPRHFDRFWPSDPLGASLYRFVAHDQVTAVDGALRFAGKLLNVCAEPAALIELDNGVHVMVPASSIAHHAADPAARMWEYLASPGVSYRYRPSSSGSVDVWCPDSQTWATSLIPAAVLRSSTITYPISYNELPPAAREAEATRETNETGSARATDATSDPWVYLREDHPRLDHRTWWRYPGADPGRRAQVWVPVKHIWVEQADTGNELCAAMSPRLHGVERSELPQEAREAE